MNRFFAIDLLGNKSRIGKTIFDSAVASLVNTSFMRDKTPEEIVGLFFSLVDQLGANHKGYVMDDLDFAHLVDLSVRFPKLNPKYLLDLEVQFYAFGKVGPGEIQDQEIISLMELLLQRDKGQMPSERQLLEMIQAFYSIKGQTQSQGISDAQIVQLMWLDGYYYHKTAPDVVPLFINVNAHTRNNPQLTLDVVEYLLNDRASKSITSEIKSRDILEALFVLKDRGHKMLQDEFVKRRYSKGTKS
jgi:hypothetical protein